MPEEPNIPSREPPPPPEGARPSPHAYAELDVTTNFSFLRGASHPDELVFRAAVLGYRAIGIADRNSLAGVVRAHDAVRQVTERGGVAPRLVIGTRLVFADGPEVLVYPTDRSGYGRLCRLLTTGKRRAKKGECLLYLEDFLQNNQGMVGIIDGSNTARWFGGPTTLLLTGDTRHSAGRRLREAMGDRASLAASAVYGGDDVAHLEHLAKLSRRLDLPLVATNGVHYHDPGRRRLQDVLTCVREGCTIAEAGYRLFPNGERYLKEPGQMHRLFAGYPRAIRRGLEIAERCAFSLDQLQYEYPDELAAPGETPLTYLERLTWAGAAERYLQGVPPGVRDQVRRELELIGRLKYEAYFLTVHDLVRFARSRDILCQGRGSAANSAVCYCLGVTAVDPTMTDLLFERFVSAARNEPPDIDVDFEHERREEVIQYVYEKYGRERAGMTAVVITYRGRSAVRDVGKAMGLSLDLVDQMAKKLDWWHAGSVTPTMLGELGLDAGDQTVRRVVELTGQILGFPRHLSQHVGGMVMTRGPLCELVPIENAAMDGRTVIEWDKDDIDTLGILKVDVLALGMLTALAKGLKLVNATRPNDPPVELHTIPPEDPGVYAMASDADTVGVFQIESRAQMSMLPRLRPNKFYDLVIEVAIVRPGPIQGDMVHPYLRRRSGAEPVSFPKPELEAVLGKTLGVPLFQEQAMRIAIECAGFTPEQADRLRRAVTGFRRLGDVETFAKQFTEGMQQRGFEPDFARRCFDQIRGFASYGFPESHAASFALLVYASAWVKRYHPAAFCCALLNSQPMGFYAPAQLVRDAREHGVEVRPIDVNASDWDCTLEDVPAANSFATAPPSAAGPDKRAWGIGAPAVRLGFRLVKGLRREHGERVAEARRRSGAFGSVAGFHRATTLPAAAVRRLAEADALGSLGLSRRAAVWQTLELKDEEAPLFAENPEPVAAITAAAADDGLLPTMPLGQEVMTDYATTSLSLKRHPVALVREQLNAQKVRTAAEVSETPHGRWVRVAGLVLMRQRPGTASGIVFETLEDETGVVNLIIRPDVFERHQSAARHARLLRADGYVERQGQVVHVMAKRLFDLGDMLQGHPFQSRDFH